MNNIPNAREAYNQTTSLRTQDITYCINRAIGDRNNFCILSRNDYPWVANLSNQKIANELHQMLAQGYQMYMYNSSLRIEWTNIENARVGEIVVNPANPNPNRN